MDDYYAMYDEMQAEIRQLKETIRRLEDKIWEIEGKNDKKMTALTLKYEEKLHEKDCVISDLTNRLAQAQALLAHDGTNTGLPTSQTPPGKKKRIPNARTKTGKKKGGQPGHEKHVLEGPEDDAVTDVVGHGSGEEDFLCPECNGENFVPTILTKKQMYLSERKTAHPVGSSRRQANMGSNLKINRSLFFSRTADYLDTFLIKQQSF